MECLFGIMFGFAIVGVFHVAELIVDCIQSLETRPSKKPSMRGIGGDERLALLQP